MSASPPSKVGKSARKANRQKSTTLKTAERSAAKGKRVSKKKSAPAVKAKGANAAKSTRKKRVSAKAAGKSAGAKRTSRSESPPAVSQDMKQFRDEVRPLPKTHLTDAELQEFRDLLLHKRAELAGDIQRLASEALNSSDSAQDQHSAMPIHMADLGSDNWEKEFTLGLLANERALVREIDEAFDRIENKSYGICLATHKRISKARLRAKPWAEYCIEYARALEEGRVP